MGERMGRTGRWVRENGLQASGTGSRGARRRGRNPRRRGWTVAGGYGTEGEVQGPLTPVVAAPRRRCRLAQFSISVTACSTDSRAM